MPQIVAALALVAAQALSWAAGPLFVCTDRAGDVCVDRGPQNCDCCHGDERCDLAATASQAVTAAPCDCEHQLLEALPTTPAPRTATVGVEHSSHAPQWLPAAAFSACAASSELVAIASPTPAAAAQRPLATVALRC
jgi:hypothetical protein